MVALWIAGYLVLSAITGNWITTLVIFPAFGLFWLYLLAQVRRSRRTRGGPPKGHS